MKEISEYLAENKALMLEVLRKLVSYPSVYAEDDERYPFGKANAECLDYALQVCADFGLRTKNLDYYAGFGEIGSGEQLLGIIGHLDVVPTGKNWNSDPFEMVIKDGKLYGRGVGDDKGPMVAALFAVKYLIDSKVDLAKRIRIVFGCNEESGFGCIKHYVEKEGHFDLGFTPDGPFPCCFGEKGIIHLRFSTPNKIFKELKGGLATNVVADSCQLVIPASGIKTEEMIKFFAQSPITDYSLIEEDDKLTLAVTGKGAHASMPEDGINAISYALSALAVGQVNDEAVQEFYQKINTELNGESSGVHFTDQYGELTLNVGNIDLIADKIVFDIDIRCPFTIANQEVITNLQKNFKYWQVEVLEDKPGLYQPEDSPFVKLLTETYNEISGNDKKPITMGGGTYARGINNTLAFGVSEDEDNHIHDANEFLREDNLLRYTTIYIKTLLKMLEL